MCNRKNVEYTWIFEEKQHRVVNLSYFLCLRLVYIALPVNQNVNTSHFRLTEADKKEQGFFWQWWQTKSEKKNPR